MKKLHFMEVNSFVNYCCLGAKHRLIGCKKTLIWCWQIKVSCLSANVSMKSALTMHTCWDERLR